MGDLKTAIRIPGLERPELIGRGGSALVYRAFDVENQQFVAVKVLRSNPDETLARRFDRERLIMASLADIEGVASIDRSGQLPDGSPYFVMPFYSGGSLQQRIDSSGPLPWLDAVELVEKVGRTLTATHEAGVYHRDLKPANILLTGEGEPRVSDFGAGRLVDGSDVRSTATPMLTLAYSPPEVFTDGVVDYRQVDVYGLAATLWALLAGQPPFRRDGEEHNTLVLITRIAQEPVEELPESVPRSIRLLVQDSMAKKPEDRPPSMASFVARLQRCREAVVRGSELPAKPSDGEGPFLEVASARREIISPARGRWAAAAAALGASGAGLLARVRGGSGRDSDLGSGPNGEGSGDPLGHDAASHPTTSPNGTTGDQHPGATSPPSSDGPSAAGGGPSGSSPSSASGPDGASHDHTKVTRSRQLAGAAALTLVIVVIAAGVMASIEPRTATQEAVSPSSEPPEGPATIEVNAEAPSSTGSGDRSARTGASGPASSQTISGPEGQPAPVSDDPTTTARPSSRGGSSSPALPTTAPATPTTSGPSTAAAPTAPTSTTRSSTTPSSTTRSSTPPSSTTPSPTTPPPTTATTTGSTSTPTTPTTTPTTTTTAPPTTTTAPPTTAPTTTTTAPPTTTTTTIPQVVANPDSAVVGIDEAVNIMVLANDDAGPSSWNVRSLRIVSGPSFAASAFVQGSHIRYVADDDYTGIDTLRYEICTADGRCDRALVTVTVTVTGESA